MRKYFLIGILAVSTLAACKKKPDPTPPAPPAPQPKCGFTLVSDEFPSDHRFDLKDVNSQEVVAFQPSDGTLQPIIKGPTTDNLYEIDINSQWKASSPKTVTFDNNTTFMNIAITGTDATTDTLQMNLSSKDVGGTVTITKFGDVGQTVEGTFKGVFNNGGGTDVSVKDGKFILKRDPDL